MVYADYQKAKKLAGDPDDITDAEILAAVAYGDARVEAETGVTNWLVDDVEYPLIEEASEYFLSSWIRDRFNDPERQGDKHYQKAIDICDSIRKSATQSILITSSQYRTFPLNKKANLYRSLPGGGGGSTERQPFGDPAEDGI